MFQRAWRCPPWLAAPRRSRVRFDARWGAPSPRSTSRRRRPARGWRNGSKASNTGKLKSEPVAIIICVPDARSGSAGIGFEKVFRAKLQKKTKYMDELRAEALLERAIDARPDLGPAHAALALVLERSMQAVDARVVAHYWKYTSTHP